MSNGAQQFRLIVERAHGADRWPATLEVPEGVSFLRLRQGEPPLVLASDPTHRQHDGDHDHDDAAAAAIAPIPRGTSRLLVASLKSSVRIAGQPAPLVAIAEPGDVVLLEGAGDYDLHVTVYDVPHVGPAGPEWDGKECAVCRTPVQSAQAVIYRCRCGSAAMHCEPDGPDALQCARLASTCPHCGQALIMTQGYRFLPEGFGGT